MRLPMLLLQCTSVRARSVCTCCCDISSYMLQRSPHLEIIAAQLLSPPPAHWQQSPRRPASDPRQIDPSTDPSIAIPQTPLKRARSGAIPAHPCARPAIQPVQPLQACLLLFIPPPPPRPSPLSVEDRPVQLVQACCVCTLHTLRYSTSPCKLPRTTATS